jgi:hypothetical protein
LNDGDLIAQYIGFDPKRTLAALQVLITGSQGGNEYTACIVPGANFVETPTMRRTKITVSLFVSRTPAKLVTTIDLVDECSTCAWS